MSVFVCVVQVLPSPWLTPLSAREVQLGCIQMARFVTDLFGEQPFKKLAEVSSLLLGAENQVLHKRYSLSNE